MEGADKSHRACRGFLEVAHVASVGVIDDAETERSIPLSSVPPGPSSVPTKRFIPMNGTRAVINMQHHQPANDVVRFPPRTSPPRVRRPPRHGRRRNLHRHPHRRWPRRRSEHHTRVRRLQIRRHHRSRPALCRQHRARNHRSPGRQHRAQRCGCVSITRCPLTLHSIDVSPVQYTPNIAYWSPNSYYMEFQNAYVASTDPFQGPHTS
jgi:hypothetical protein